MSDSERDPWLDEEPREMTDGELDEFAAPSSCVPGVEKANGRKPRKPRTRFEDQVTGEKIAKRDVKAVIEAGKLGPKVASEITGKAFPIAKAAKGCPLPAEEQQAVFADMRRGYQEQTAVERNGHSYPEWLRWKSESPAFRDRVDAHKSTRAAKIEKAMMALAEGRVVKRKKTQRFTCGEMVKGGEGSYFWHGFDKPELKEVVVEETSVPPSMDAARLWLAASGREGFKPVEDKRGGALVILNLGTGEAPPGAELIIAAGAGKLDAVPDAEEAE